MAKLKVGQAVKRPESDGDSDERRRENRWFVVLVIGVPLVLIVVITLVSRFKLLG